MTANLGQAIARIWSSCRSHHARATRVDLRVLVITGHAHAVELAEPEWWGLKAT
jgi:hypothetical protein